MSVSLVEGGYKANRHNAAALAREKHIRTRVAELQEEQLATHVYGSRSRDAPSALVNGLMPTLRIPTAPVFRPLVEPARYKGAYGGRGSGKSRFGLVPATNTLTALQRRFCFPKLPQWHKDCFTACRAA